MSSSAISGASGAAAASSAATVSTTASAKTSVTGRAADGDYLHRSSKTSQVKDSDGDYKPLAASSSAAATSSSGVQAALTLLKTGG
jgi:hypothetical protein